MKLWPAPKFLVQSPQAIIPVSVSLDSFRQKNPRLFSEMQEKKGGDMATTKSPKKTNLLDHSSIKHILDESVTEVLLSLSLMIRRFICHLGKIDLWISVARSWRAVDSSKTWGWVTLGCLWERSSSLLPSSLSFTARSFRRTAIFSSAVSSYILFQWPLFCFHLRFFYFLFFLIRSFFLTFCVDPFLGCREI